MSGSHVEEGRAELLAVRDRRGYTLSTLVRHWRLESLLSSVGLETGFGTLGMSGRGERAVLEVPGVLGGGEREAPLERVGQSVSLVHSSQSPSPLVSVRPTPGVEVSNPVRPTFYQYSNLPIPSKSLVLSLDPGEWKTGTSGSPGDPGCDGPPGPPGRLGSKGDPGPFGG